MEAQLADRSNQLQSMLSQSHSVQDSIDNLQRWLEQAEKNTSRVVNAPIIIRKEALLELLQDHKVGSSFLLLGDGCSQISSADIFPNPIFTGNISIGDYILGHFFFWTIFCQS